VVRGRRGLASHQIGTYWDGISSCAVGKFAALRFLLAIVAFVIAAPLLFFGGVNSYIFISENSSFGIQVMLALWPFMVLLGVILLLGFAFLIAGIAILTVRSTGPES